MYQQTDPFADAAEQFKYDIKRFAQVYGLSANPLPHELQELQWEAGQHLHRDTTEPGYIAQILQCLDPQRYVARRGIHTTLIAPKGLTWREAPLKPATIVNCLWPDYRSELHAITINEEGVKLSNLARTRFRIIGLELPTDDDTRLVLSDTIQRLSDYQLDPVHITQQVNMVAYSKDANDFWNMVSAGTNDDSVVALPVQVVR